MKYVVICGIALMSAGCAQFLPSAAQLKALSESGRSWCVNVIVPGMGTGRASGTGIEGGTVTCTNDSMTVDSKPVAPAPAK